MHRSILIILVFFSCNSQPVEERRERSPMYSNSVGDIGFDKDIDDPHFTWCRPYGSSPQYYELGGLKYKGEMRSIKETIHRHFKSTNLQGQSGFLTVRFVVNCKGETGRFRTYSTNRNLEDFEFDKSITAQLLTLTKDLSDWEIGRDINGVPLDYYQYLTFKILDGQLKEITP